jgi:hypothetical protein
MSTPKQPCASGPAAPQFTLTGLSTGIALELSRAQAGLTHAQAEATQAMTAAWPEGEGWLAGQQLGLNKVELQLSLVLCPAPWWRRLWRSLRQWLGISPPTTRRAPLRYRFAAPVEASLQLKLVMERQANGRWHETQREELANAGTT